MTGFWSAPRDRVLALRPTDFRVSRVIPTRWRDNDIYGHINNAIYYEYFDTAINTWLLERLPATPSRETTRMFVAESACRYLSEITYPEPLLLSHSVARLGTSSVVYELGIFAGADGAGPIAALGRWVHVFVDAASRRPVPIPADFHAVLAEATTVDESGKEGAPDRG